MPNIREKSKDCGCSKKGNPLKRELCAQVILKFIIDDQRLFFTTSSHKFEQATIGFSKSTIYRAIDQLTKERLIVVAADHYGNVYIPNWRDWGDELKSSDFPELIFSP